MTVAAKMTAIADAIRSKTGGTSPLTLDQMATEIANLPDAGSGGSGGGVSLNTCTINFSYFKYYKTYYFTIENDAIVFKNGVTSSTGTITALCDSLIFVEINEGTIGHFECDSGLEVIHYLGACMFPVFRTPSTGDAICNVTIVEDFI